MRNCASVVLVLTLVFSHIACVDNEQTAAINEQVGKTIVDAIESWRRDKGSYPVSLEELAPNYIKELPIARNAEWKYSRSDDGYFFAFEGVNDDYPTGYWDRDESCWMTDTK